MKKIIMAIILMVIFSPFANATVTEVTAEASSSRVTTGTSVSVACTVTASESETTSLQLISTPSGITISDPAGGSYSSVSVSTTPTTKTFTMSASSADTYSYYAQAGSTSSTEKTIIFEDPSILTTDGSPSTTTKSGGQSFTLSIDISNAQEEDITTSYELSYTESDFSITGDPTSSSSLEVGSGSTTNLQWTVTLDGDISSGSHSIDLELGDNDEAFTVSVTVPGSGTTTTTIDGGGGPGGGGGTATDDETTTTIEDAADGEVVDDGTGDGTREDEEDGRESKESREQGVSPIQVPEDIETQVMISLGIFIVLVLLVAYWKRHEIFKLDHKKKKYVYKPKNDAVNSFKKTLKNKNVKSADEIMDSLKKNFKKKEEKK